MYLVQLNIYWNITLLTRHTWYILGHLSTCMSIHLDAHTRSVGRPFFALVVWDLRLKYDERVY